MFCPECNLENVEGAKFCVHCGSILTQTELTTPSANRTNQVWNTEIEKEKNKANRRVAMMALGTVIVLVLALIAAVWFSLPAMGDTLIGAPADGESFTDRLSDFWEDFVDSFEWDNRSPQPEPGTYADIQGEADEEFLELLAKYLEKDYEGDYADRLVLPGEYVKQFEALLTADFADEDLVSYTTMMVTALRNMRDSVDSYSGKAEDSYVADYQLWLTGYVTLCQVTEDMYNTYGIMHKHSYIPEFYIDMLPIYEAELMVEQDLTWQLVGTEPEWDPVRNCYILPYTNCTEYELDITFYNDYETEDDYFYEEYTINGIEPEERVVIELREMPDEYLFWYIDWIVEDYYIDGIELYDYYW